jgi:hypothetical protein
MEGYTSTAGRILDIYSVDIKQQADETSEELECRRAKIFELVEIFDAQSTITLIREDESFNALH